MADAEEDSGCNVKDSGDARRTRAPSRKKFDEEMEGLTANIRRTEEELEELKTTGPSSFANAQKNLKAEKNANIERRKKIDADLERLNKDVSGMMHSISRLESTLHYRSEDKIDEAIRRLDWSLKVQNFKLSQEKKIVAEIDSLRRSKKTLIQYRNLKKDKDAMRDRQRRMREERDYYFHKVTQLKQREEKLRAENSGQRARVEQLKKELDSLYESKRQMLSMYKKQRDDFFDDREKRRHESFKKRQEEKQVLQAALRKEIVEYEAQKQLYEDDICLRNTLIEEYEAQKQPYEDNICLCNTLIHYLHRFVSNTDLDASSPGLSLTPPPPALPSPCDESPPSGPPSGPAEELEDGQYVLLRKSEDDNYVSCSAKHATRKQRRSRKQSMVKRITHTPEVLAQFLQLNLNAPTTVSEILASMEQLRARKLYYEREAEVQSELSVTESAQCEVSRQASHTESNDGLCESHPSDHVMEQLLLSVCDQACPHAGHTSDTSTPADLTDNPPSDLDALCLQCSSSNSAEAESSCSGSRSEGSDSTPRGSLTAEGACGGTEESHGHCVRDESVPDSFTNENSRNASVYSTTKSDTDSGDVFYAKKAQPAHSASSGDICSDFGSKTVIDASRSSAHMDGQLSVTDNHRTGDICEGAARDKTTLDNNCRNGPHCDSSNSRTTIPDNNKRTTIPDNSHVSSLDEFPALVREGCGRVGGGQGDLHGPDAFLLQGGHTGLADSTRL